MRAARNLWTRALAGALALMMALTLCAAPVAAGDAIPAGAPPNDTTLAAAALARLDTFEPPPAAFAPDPAQAPAVSDEKPFLKSKKGVLAVALMVAGTAFTFYSKRNDRIKSQVR